MDPVVAVPAAVVTSPIWVLPAAMYFGVKGLISLIRHIKRKMGKWIYLRHGYVGKRGVLIRNGRIELKFWGKGASVENFVVANSHLMSVSRDGLTTRWRLQKEFHSYESRRPWNKFVTKELTFHTLGDAQNFMQQFFAAKELTLPQMLSAHTWRVKDSESGNPGYMITQKVNAKGFMSLYVFGADFQYLGFVVARVQHEPQTSGDMQLIFKANNPAGDESIRVRNTVDVAADEFAHFDRYYTRAVDALKRLAASEVQPIIDRMARKSAKTRVWRTRIKPAVFKRAWTIVNPEKPVPKTIDKAFYEAHIPFKARLYQFGTKKRFIDPSITPARLAAHSNWPRFLPTDTVRSIRRSIKKQTRKDVGKLSTPALRAKLYKERASVLYYVSLVGDSAVSTLFKPDRPEESQESWNVSRGAQDDMRNPRVDLGGLPAVPAELPIVARIGECAGLGDVVVAQSNEHIVANGGGANACFEFRGGKNLALTHLFVDRQDSAGSFLNHVFSQLHALGHGAVYMHLGGKPDVEKHMSSIVPIVRSEDGLHKYTLRGELH